MKPSARLYHCARCHCQVVICRHCDTGNVYCQSCAKPARKESLRRAARKYQSTRAGRFANARRQSRYRARQQQKVTHQGSPTIHRNDLLPASQNRLQNPRRQTQKKYFLDKTVIHCHFCQRECDVFLRRDFLRPPMRRSRR